MSETTPHTTSSAARERSDTDAHTTTTQSNGSPKFSHSNRDKDDDDDDEKLFAELDEELDMMEDESNYDGFSRNPHANSDTVASFDMAEFRERRMQEIRQEIASRTSDGDSLNQSQHASTASMKGLLTDISNEKDLIQFSSTESRVAIHFYHPKFQRCALLDRHLAVLARLHPTTLFVKTNVLTAPFLVQKLKITVLPCLVTFRDGISKDKIVGFEELGNSDKFSTGALEWRLGQSGIIDPRENRKPILGFNDSVNDNVGRDVVGRRQEQSDDFWDDD